MTQDKVTQIGALLAKADAQLFEIQYAIGKLILDEVGRDLTPGNGKGEPSHHGRKGFKRSGGLMTVCTQLATAYKRRGRSAAWFKATYYMARAFTPAQYDLLVYQQPTQAALVRLMHKTPEEIDGAIALGNLDHDPRRKGKGKGKPELTDEDIHGGHAPDNSNVVMIDLTWSPVSIADAVANALTRIRDAERRAEVREHIKDVLRRVR